MLWLCHSGKVAKISYDRTSGAADSEQQHWCEDAIIESTIISAFSCEDSISRIPSAIQRNCLVVTIMIDKMRWR
jgi:hypothetical protein